MTASGLSERLSRYDGIVDDAAAFRDALRRPMPRFIWTHRLRIEPQRLSDILHRDGYRLESLPWIEGAFRVHGEGLGLGSHWSYLAGLFQIQEASSMVPMRVLDPRPGERVLDLCAAPGNKTAQAALALGNRGTVIANDPVAGRLRSLRMTIDRLGLLNVTVTCYDGVNYPRRAGAFDCVLVDAPCSCEGTTRRRPGLLQRPPGNIARRVRTQRLLLRQAVRRCRPGGRILYSTCTYAPEENEAVVDAVVKECQGQVRILPTRLEGFRTAPGITVWGRERFHPHLERTLRIWPHFNDTGGFYLALLERGPSSGPEPEPVPRVDDPGFPVPSGSHQRPAPDAAGVAAAAADRFGFGASAFEGMQLLYKTSHDLYVVADDHRPPRMDERTMGLPLLHLRARYPKLTTAAAAAFGRFADCNVVDVHSEQLTAFLARRSFQVTGRQAADCPDDGYVLVRYQSSVLGVGMFRAGAGTVESFFPKRMALPV